MKTTNKYFYQIEAANKVLEMALDTSLVASILAAAPGSGKSTMAIHILNNLFKIKPNFKVIILTHNQNILKDQMIDNFETPNVDVNFTFGAFGSGSQVEIGIPSSSADITEMDLLMVDEAHQYYYEPMVDKIVAKFNPKHQILMTGSPSYFIKYNNAVDKSNKDIKKFGIHFIAANDLLDGVFSAIDLDVVRYDGNNLLEKVKAVYKQAKQRRYNMTKVMWACSNIKEANDVAKILKETFRKEVFVSTSKNDKDNDQIDNFKKSTNSILIVVNKGILGFSDNTITSLVDFKCSKDLDNRNQFFARGLRVHPNNIKKAYLSVSTSENWNREGQILNQVVSLMDRKVFTKYDGTPLKNSMKAA